MLGNKLRTTSIAAALMAGVAGGAMADSPNIRVVLKGAGPEDFEHIARIQSAMNDMGTEIEIELLELPSSGYADKLNLMLLGGDIPDLIYFQGGDKQIADQGILEDWRPWIAGTTDLKAALWPHNVSRLDNYPYLLYIFPARTKSPVMRADWLAKTGMAAPTSLDDWTALLKNISQSAYDGDGTMNTFGIMAPGNTKEMDAVFNQAFGVTGAWIKDASGAWGDARTSTQERDKLGYYNMLYSEGLLDPEFITKNWEVKEDDFYTGEVGVIMGTAGPVVGIYNTKMQQVNPGVELALLEPPAGLQAVNVSKESRGFAMSAVSEHKELVVKLVDFLASDEGQMIERLGVEGIHFVRNGDTIEATDKMGTWYPRFFINNPDSWTPPVDLLAPVAQASLEQGVKYFTPDNAFVFPADLAVDVDAAENFYRTAVFRFISGELSLDDWDAYVADFNAAGGAKLTEYARTVLK